MSKHFRTSNTMNSYSNDYRKEINVPMESSISNLEQEEDDDDICDDDQKHIEEDDEDDEEERIMINRRSNDFVNDISLNHHGHIENHASPRQVTPKSSNPYELVIDQKKLHKIIKSVHYPV